MKFSYQAYDRSGGGVTDVLEAPDVADARETLARRGLFVTELTETAVTDTGAPVAKKSSKIGLGKLRTLAMFTRQLHVLLGSGTQIVPALGALERQTKQIPWRRTISSVRAHVEQGSSLSEAMGRFPNYFDSVYTSMIAAGESGGALGDMLGRLADMTIKTVHIKGSVRGAMVYPCMLLVIAMSVIIMLLTFVVPRFTGLFASMGVALPPTTAALVFLSSLLRSYWWVLVLMIVGGVVGMSKWLSTPSGVRSVDGIVLRLPKFGVIIKDFATAKIARLLGSLLSGHVPVLEALRLTQNATKNVHYAELMATVERNVSRGEPISAAFARSNLITPSVYEATRSGEQSGQVGPLLLHLADFLDEQNDVILKSLTSIIEPAILVLLGLLVGFVAISMFLPLFDLTAMTGG